MKNIIKEFVKKKINSSMGTILHLHMSGYLKLNIQNIYN